MRPWKKWLVKVLHLNGTLDTDKALREKNRRILELERALAEEIQRRMASVRAICATCKHDYEPKGHLAIYIDPRIRQQGYEQSAWNAEPERNTDAVQSARQRAAMHQAYPQVGDLSRHDAEVQRKKARITQQLDPETKILPTVPQPHKPHFHKLRADPDSTFNAL